MGTTIYQRYSTGDQFELNEDMFSIGVTLTLNLSISLIPPCDVRRPSELVDRHTTTTQSDPNTRNWKSVYSYKRQRAPV